MALPEVPVGAVRNPELPKVAVPLPEPYGAVPTPVEKDLPW